MSDSLENAADAVRFRIVNRLASGIRHDLLGTLNTIALAAQLGERQLAKDQPDIARIAEHFKRIQARAQETSIHYTQVVAWLDVRASTIVDVEMGVRQCMGMLHSELTLNGVSVQLEIDRHCLGCQVSRIPLQYALAATVLAWMDESFAARLRVQTQVSEGVVELSIDNEMALNPKYAPPVNPMTWAAVEHLARIDRIEIHRSDSKVNLILPLAS